MKNNINLDKMDIEQQKRYRQAKIKQTVLNMIKKEQHFVDRTMRRERKSPFALSRSVKRPKLQDSMSASPSEKQSKSASKSPPKVNDGNLKEVASVEERQSTRQGTASSRVHSAKLSTRNSARYKNLNIQENTLKSTMN